MPTITTTLYNKGKAQSGTSIQKTLKDEATTYFAKVAIGNSGTGSLVIADGASKGVVALIGPQDGQSAGNYLFIYPEQKQWLGAPSVVASPTGDPDAGNLYSTWVQVNPSVDLATTAGLDIVGIGSSSVGIVRVATYQHTGSEVASGSIPQATNLPSGSSLLLTIVGTTSQVF
jgi:hypothetical protein